MIKNLLVEYLKLFWAFLLILLSFPLFYFASSILNLGISLFFGNDYLNSFALSLILIPLLMASFTPFISSVVFTKVIVSKFYLRFLIKASFLIATFIIYIPYTYFYFVIFNIPKF